jgi:hypothetical protein
MGYEIRVGPGGVANTQDIYNYLTGPKELGGYGYSTTSALGLMSNMQRESGFITNVTEYGGGPGIGLFQYTYPPRKAEFIAAVPDWQTNPKAQIDFALTGETTLGITGIPNSQLLQNIMNSDGEFVHILSKYTLGFVHSASYVSDEHSKDKDFYKGFELCKQVISKIYS